MKWLQYRICLLGKSGYSLIIGLVSFIFLSFGVNADKKSFLISQAAAPYIMSTHSMSALSRTECGYAIKYNYDVQAAEREVIEAMRPIDRAQMNQFFASKKYRDSLNHQVQEVRTMLDSVKANGIDDKTACGMIIGMTVDIYTQSLRGWTAAVQEYKN